MWIYYIINMACNKGISIIAVAIEPFYSSYSLWCQLDLMVMVTSDTPELLHD
jgi:hypothetical protein